MEAHAAEDDKGKHSRDTHRCTALSVSGPPQMLLQRRWQRQRPENPTRNARVSSARARSLLLLTLLFVVASSFALLPLVSATDGVNEEWPISAAFRDSTCFSAAELADLDITPSKRVGLPPLRMERNLWQAHYLSTAVAAILLRETLGYDVIIEDTDGIAVYERCAGEGTRVNMETWPLSLSSVTHEEVFTNTGQCTDAGALGVIGRSGWYEPTYLETDPATRPLYMEFWRAFTNPAVTALFPKSGTLNESQLLGAGRAFVPPWCVKSTTPAGCSYSSLDDDFVAGNCVVEYNEYCIELLAIDASYDAGLLPQQVRNNHLNITVPYLSESNFYDEVYRRYDAAIPFLLYYWQPSAFVLSRDFTRVSLPEWTPQCFRNDTASLEGYGSVNCDFPSQYLAKIFSSTLLAEEGFKDATRALERITLSNIDQTTMLHDLGLDDVTLWDQHAFDIACQWLKDNSFSLRTWAVNTPMPEYYVSNMSSGTQYAIVALVALGGLCSLALHVLLFRARSHPLIVASSVAFCQLIVAGSWFAYSAVLILPYRAHSGVCMLVPALLCLGFALSFGALIIKTYRLAMIFSRKSLQVIKITNSDLFKVIAALTLMDGVIFAAWGGTTPAQMTLTSSSLDALALVQTCTSEAQGGLWYALLVAPKALLVLFGIRCAYQVRHVASNFNEAKWIGIAIYNLSIIAVLVLPLLEVLGAQADVSYLLFSFGVLLPTWVTLGALFVPKFAVVLRHGGGGGNGGGNLSTLHTHATMNGTTAHGTVGGGGHSTHVEMANKSGGGGGGGGSGEKLFVGRDQLKPHPASHGKTAAAASPSSRENNNNNCHSPQAQRHGQLANNHSAVSSHSNNNTNNNNTLSSPTNSHQPLSPLQQPSPPPHAQPHQQQQHAVVTVHSNPYAVHPLPSAAEDD